MHTIVSDVAPNSGYNTLKSIACRLMSGEGRQCTLTATGLVHELYLRVAKGSSGADPSSPQQIPFASRVMRQILIDRARRRQSRRRAEVNHLRSAVCPMALSESENAVTEKVIQLEDALQLLGNEMPETAELVRMRVYLDVSIESAAAQLGLSRATAYRKWIFAKAWLTRHLQWPLDF